MASNNNNNAALWRNIKKIKKTIKNYKHYAHWVDLLSCEIWKCKEDKDGKNEPILNENGKLPESRIDKLEENLGSSDWDTSSEDSLEEGEEEDEDIQQLKDVINQLNARSEHYATKQQLGEVAEIRRGNQQRLNVIGGQIDDLEAFRNAMEADRDALEARIVDIEEQRSGTGGTGGGKRRKKRTRKKRRKKKTKKRRKKKTKKRRQSRRKSKGRKRRRKKRTKRRK